MSDMFDHEADAYDDYVAREEQEDEYPSSRIPFVADPLHYHTLVMYDAYRTSTAKATLICYNGRDIWIPSALIRKHDATKKSMYVLTEFWKNKLRSLATGQPMPKYKRPKSSKVKKRRKAA